MTDDTTQAFAHPEHRAAATPFGDTPADRISVRDHVVAVEIGAFEVERDVTQRLSFDVVVEIPPHGGAATDDVDDILSYDTITDAITTELAAERLNLLETLAERIADRLLAEPQPLRVFVRIQKLDRGPGKLGVEIVRRRGDAAHQANAPTLRPLILHLPQIPADLTTRLDALAADPRPVIVTLGAGENPAASTPAAQRRIDLLALDQAAWQLASRDARCSVVATRTELDWALKQGLICVWAPSKLVLDAVDGPTGPVDATELTRWIAGQINADETRIEGPA